ncbi:probable E3 ubiquitin-protein ligase RNF144A-A [Channa argus]|uniref:probable E3 ubiquitin-protein ligase RNF144A-A n=1 Tax=Channa argus TaxID=215402 RepID=UPI003521CBAC
MGSNLTATQEKCYDPQDSTFTFVDREDEMDFLCEGFQSRRALMSCGHAVTPMSLTNWCRRLLKEGESRFVCGQSGCNVEWSYAEVCKMALLTTKEMEYFEKNIIFNAMRQCSDTKICPECKSSVERMDISNLNVRCTVCILKKGEIYEFCWQCLRKWKGPAPRSDRCGNPGCTNESLETLQNCPDINLKYVEGVTACPSIRACPTCGILLERDKKRCKNITCPRCKIKFCFVCLKLTEECLPTSDYYIQCASGVAPRQASLPVWQKK